MKNYGELKTDTEIEMTMKSLTDNGFLPEVVNTSLDAMEKIKSLIPAGASIMNGSSTTLQEIGFIDLLKGGNTGWNNLHENVLKETDPAKQANLRKEVVLSDYYLGSVHAVSKDGVLLIASNSGSQLPHLAFTSANLILIVGTQKITENLTDSMQRVREYIFPLEDARMKSVNMGGSYISKELILYKEQSWSGRKVHVIFVKEKLGF